MLFVFQEIKKKFTCSQNKQLLFLVGAQINYSKNYFKLVKQYLPAMYAGP